MVSSPFSARHTILILGSLGSAPFCTDITLVISVFFSSFSIDVTVAEDFDDAYKRISEQINELKKAKLRLVQEKKQAESYGQRLVEMDSTLKTVKPQVREFDEDLVRRLIQSIEVKKGERLGVQFESGI